MLKGFQVPVNSLFFFKSQTIKYGKESGTLPKPLWTAVGDGCSLAEYHMETSVNLLEEVTHAALVRNPVGIPSYQPISELKWMGMGEFNSVDHYIYYCSQKSLRNNGVALIVNKRV